MKDKLLERLDEDRVKMFWWFICERQRIYWKREAGEPRPWTKNEILHNHFFCNIYREQDRGTQFYINNVLKKSRMKGDSYADTIFKTLMYRLFNEPTTYQFLEKILDRYDGKEAADKLDRKHDAGIRIFRSAWMTSGANIKVSKARAYCLDMKKVFKRREDIAYLLMRTGKMEDAWKIVSSLKWFGGFSAYQVVLDLSYIPRFKNNWEDFDAWVYPGPGAKMGLLWLMGHNIVKTRGARINEKVSYNECERLIEYLTKNQQRYFTKYGLSFKKWNDEKLNIHHIEFSLCEWNKFMRASRGGKKRKFIPRKD